ncbi:sulfatase [Roseivirga sp.]|uniref:sulfatase family protein n=1 Tax=Roseivirga sp. TaxID=1964215 RepID=UPI003B52AAB4
MKRLLFPLLLIPLLWSCEKDTSESTSTPNIIIVFTDDQGYQDIGTNGAVGFETPNLDRMAAEGIRFTDFYAAQAVCSASRAGLLTGCYPNRLGIHGAFMPNAKKGLNPNEVTIAEMLKDNGYQTAIYGKWHLGDAQEFLPTRQGFDEYFGIPYSNDMWPYHPQQGPVFNFGPLPLYENEEIIDTLTDQSSLTTQITERSVDFIRRHKDQPFFLYVAHPQPHVPLFVSDKFKGKSERGLYGDVIMEIDWSVGEILKELKAQGIDENTLVIFTSDNGPWLNYGEHSGSALPLREGKGTALEGGQREPAIARWPGKLEAGKTISTPMMNIDVLPTIAEITGSQLPQQTIDGKSVWKVWTGETSDSPQEAYYFYYHVNELQGVRYKNWKMYFPHSYRSLNGREGGKDGLPVPYEYLKFEEIALYDLSQDISETTDVASEYPEVVEEIKALAANMRQRLGDALTQVEGSETRQPGMIEN